MMFYNKNPLYDLMELQRAIMTPLNMWAHLGQNVYGNNYNPLAYNKFGKQAAAGFELMERLTRYYAKPEFGITETMINGKPVKISERIVKKRTFCNLIHFKKKDGPKQSKLLIVAPMSGHHATLLRGTVEALLPFTDVYITDWVDARDIPVAEGRFDLDDYINYVIQFIETVGANTHILAVCQPSVPVFCAVALMSQEKNLMTPSSMTLIGGPIDVRQSPTKVTKFAEEKPIDWFQDNVITQVPFNYAGFGRKVYPGFIQLNGFMTMNIDRHIDEHVKLFGHLVEGDGESAEAHKKFYNEYLSVMDMPAEFYLQTLKVVFQDKAIPYGQMYSRNRAIDPSTITKTGLLCVEGELDDISGLGQTKSAIKLCNKLPDSKKRYHMQKSVGHYGSFNGRKFREHIVPVIVNFIHENDKGNNISKISSHQPLKKAIDKKAAR